MNRLVQAVKFGAIKAERAHGATLRFKNHHVQVVSFGCLGQVRLTGRVAWIAQCCAHRAAAEVDHAVFGCFPAAHGMRDLEGVLVVFEGQADLGLLEERGPGFADEFAQLVLHVAHTGEGGNVVDGKEVRHRLVGRERLAQPVLLRAIDRIEVVGVEDDEAEVVPDVEDVVARIPGKRPRGQKVRRHGAALLAIIREALVIDDPLFGAVHVVVAEADHQRDVAAVRGDQIAAERTEKTLHAAGMFGESVIEGEVATKDGKGGVERSGQLHHLLHGCAVLRVTALDEGERTLELGREGSEAADLFLPCEAEFVGGVRFKAGEFDLRNKTFGGWEQTLPGRGCSPRILVLLPPIHGGRSGGLILPADDHGGGGIVLPSEVNIGGCSGRCLAGGQKGGQRQQAMERRGHTRRMFRRGSARRGSSARYAV